MKKANGAGTGRSKGASRTGRSRSLGRGIARSEALDQRCLEVESHDRKPPTSQIPPCLDCKDYRRDLRIFFREVRKWAPFCRTCWVQRGRPRDPFKLAEELVAQRAAREKVVAAAREAEAQRRVAAGELPW
jgi:hypothetical protein